jgi:predicted aldo/keto reductase-like oxidoreductase
MQRVVLGRTGLEAYRLGFGGIPIQRVGEAEAVETVLRALERGADFLDTSRVYTTSERRIGIALREAGIKDHPVIVASKSQSKTAEAMRADLETSLRELGLDYLDIYKCHFVSDLDDYRGVTSAGGAYHALVKARDQGLIGHIGITSHSLEVLDRALDDGLFDVIMVCFSFLEPKAREAIIPKAREKNVGVLAMKPFSGGVLDDSRLALKYALSEPGILVLAGVEHPGLFDENWEVFQEAAPLTDSENARIAELQRTHEKAFCRRCDYCQPCPEGIPIQVVMGARSMAKRMGMRTLRESRFWGTINKGRDCTECGTCLDRCPYELPIPDLMRENLRWLDEQAE